MKKAFLFVIIVIAFFSNILYSESFRVRKVITKELSETTNNEVFTLGMGEALHLHLPEERIFMQGIEMKIKIPATVAEYGGAVAYTFYTDIDPSPQETIIDYSGTQLHIDTFSHRVTYNFEIPLSDNAELSNDPYTKVINLPLDSLNKDIFFRVHIVMKGIPDGLWDSSIDVELKPILANKGLLELSVLYPEKTDSLENDFPYIVFIDDALIDGSQDALLLDVGTHHVTVSSEQYRTEVQTFAIEKANTTHVQIQLQDIAPLLAISAPENTIFLLNDVEYSDFSQPIPVTMGTHQLRFSIGEYEVIRTLEVLNGRTYAINVSFDVEITEE